MVIEARATYWYYGTLRRRKRLRECFGARLALSGQCVCQDVRDARNAPELRQVIRLYGRSSARS
eukprot:14070049-Alexandrium_andersonii.AAC.1